MASLAYLAGRRVPKNPTDCWSAMAFSTQVRLTLTVEALPDSWKEYFQEKSSSRCVKSLLIDEEQRGTLVLRKWARESDIDAHLTWVLSTRCNLIRARDIQPDVRQAPETLDAVQWSRLAGTS